MTRKRFQEQLGNFFFLQREVWVDVTVETVFLNYFYLSLKEPRKLCQPAANRALRLLTNPFANKPSHQILNLLLNIIKSPLKFQVKTFSKVAYIIYNIAKGRGHIYQPHIALYCYVFRLNRRFFIASQVSSIFKTHSYRVEACFWL